MATYGDMQTAIALWIKRDDLTSEIKSAILKAVAHYTLEEWPWTEERSTSLTTVDATKTVALPSNFSKDSGLSITVSGTTYELTRRTQQEMERLYTSTTEEGQPSTYSIWTGLIWLYPIPDGVYTLTLLYYKDLTALVNSTDTNEWTDQAEEMIEARATWWLASRSMRDPELAMAAKETELEEYQRLRARMTVRKSSGRITPYGA